MAFTVTQQSKASSIVLPAPSPNLSNALKELSYDEFVNSARRRHKQQENEPQDEDYVLSSSESSEEDIHF